MPADLRRLLALSLLATITCVASTGTAGGFSQGYQGTTAAGLSGAVTARPDLPEAGYFNPAGLVLQKPWGGGVGAAALFPVVVHEDPTTQERTRAEIDGAIPPHLHVYGRYGAFGAGLSLGIPFGSGLQWPDDWPGRFAVTSTSLRAYEVAPSLAWRPIDRLAIGAGPRFVWANVHFARRIDITRPEEEARVSLDASAFGIGGQLGIWGQPLDNLTVGLSWRSFIPLDFEGIARFDDIPPEMSHLAHDARGRTSITLPDRVALGVAYGVAALGQISLDLEFNRWSVFDRFEVQFDSDDEDFSADFSEVRDWDNTWGMRLGLEVYSPIDGLAFRSGFAVDPSPAPEETLTPAQPDTDRYIMSLGLAYEGLPGLFVDLAYNYIILSRTASSGEFAGIYDGQVHAFSLGLRF
jgi:long-chain fatty acid transport protein